MECEREKGYAEGKEEGISIERIKNARSMKSLGLGADVISQVTGLSAAEVEAL